MTTRLTYTVEEAAAILGISRTLDYESIQRGEIPAITFVRRIVIPRTSLEELVGRVPADEPTRTAV